MRPCWWRSTSSPLLMCWITKRAFAPKMSLLFIFQYLSRRRTRKAKARGRKMSSTDTSSSGSPPDSAPTSTATQHERKDYHELAQRLHPLLPETCNRLVSDDVRIADTTPCSSGGFSEVWLGSLQGRPIVVKSLRLYSSLEFDPAEVGIVSPHSSSWLGLC